MGNHLKQTRKNLRKKYKKRRLPRAVSKYPLAQRKTDFIHKCETLMKEDEFRQAYPKGYKPNSTIFVTPNILELIYGKKGFLEAGLKLHQGEFSRLARNSRKKFDALQIKNIEKEWLTTFNKLKDSSEPQAQKAIKSLDELEECFKELSGDIKSELLKEDSSKFFSNTALAVTGAIAAVGGTIAATGLTLSETCIPYYSESSTVWDHYHDEYYSYWDNTWYTTCAWEGLRTIKKVYFPLIAASPIIAYVGVGITAAGLLATAVMAAYNHYKDKKDHKKDVALLEKAEPLINKITTALEGIRQDFDKYGVDDGKLETFLEEQRGKYNTDFWTDKRKKKEQATMEKLNETIKVYVSERIAKEEKEMEANGEDSYEKLTDKRITEIEEEVTKEVMENRTHDVDYYKAIACHMIVNSCLVTNNVKSFETMAKLEKEAKAEGKKFKEKMEKLLFDSVKKEGNDKDQ